MIYPELLRVCSKCGFINYHRKECVACEHFKNWSEAK